MPHAAAGAMASTEHTQPVRAEQDVLVINNMRSRQRCDCSGSAGSGPPTAGCSRYMLGTFGHSTLQRQWDVAPVMLRL